MKKVLTALALLISSYCAAQQVESLFNSLEATPTNNKQIRIRSTNKIALNTKNNYQFTYHGLNETNSFNDYAGRNRLIAGKKDASNQAIIDVTSNEKQLKAVKAGVRNTSISKKINCYGFIDFEAGVTNDKKPTASLVAGLGKDITDKFAIEATFLANIEKNPLFYLEVQANYKLTNNLALTGRVETTFNNKPAYMAGIMLVK